MNDGFSFANLSRYLMPIAREGLQEIALATVVLGTGAAVGICLFWPVAIPIGMLWLGVLLFFRDPVRRPNLGPGELCAPADGTVRDITELDSHESVGGPAVRIGIFLSLLNVHVNRFPCAGRVRSVSYRSGEFLDARHPEAGSRNESNSLLIDPHPPMPGPIEVRQIAGMLARRIVCHAKAGQHLAGGERFGLIKFGSRTELIIPRRERTEILVAVGQRVRAGRTIIARQPVADAPVEEPVNSQPAERVPNETVAPRRTVQP